MINIAIDVMGGDNAPMSNIEGALKALGETDDLCVTLLGPEELVREKLGDAGDPYTGRITVLHAPEIISTDESPTTAIRKKPDSGIVMGMKLVKEGEADAFISAGSSGALLAGGQLIVGRISGVMRPPLATLMPTAKGRSLFLDCGANMDAKPEWLMQFARMGSIYMEKVEGHSSPTVYLANVGPEEEKGSALVKAAHALLKEAEDINYQGFIEFRDIPCGGADIVVADAFTGNAIIKTYEGVGGVLIASVKGVLMSTPVTKLGALLIMKPLKKALCDYDAAKCGGAMLLGLKGLVIKCHGNASSEEIRISIEKAVRFVREDVTGLIRTTMDGA